MSLKRRTLLLMPLAGGDMAVPTDPQRLNAFVTEYNAYVAKLAEGVVDLKLWQRVVRRWEGLR